MFPIKLILKDFVSHIYSSLDFTQFDAALIMGSFEGDPNISNGVGKTSIMTGIEFAIYGKSRFSSKVKMIRRGANKCEAEYHFISNDDVLYKIVRKLSAKTGITNVELYRKVDDEWKNETCDTSTKTNQQIVDIVGMNHDTFVNIVYCRQNDVSAFTFATASKRKEMLKEALLIGIWDEYQKVAKDKEKKLISKLDGLENRLLLIGDVKDDIKKTENEIKAKSKNIKILKKEIKEVEGVLGEIEDEISNLELNIHNEKTIEKEILNIQNRRDVIRKRRDELKNNYNINNKLIKEVSKQLGDLQEKLVTQYFTILKVRRPKEIEKEYKKLTNNRVPEIIYDDKSILALQDKYNTHILNIKKLEFDLNHLETLQPGKECPTCLSKIEDLQSVKKRRETKKKFLKNKFQEETAILNEINNELNKAKELEINANKATIEIEKIKLIIENLEAKQLNAQQNNIQIQNEVKQLSNEWDLLKERKTYLSGLTTEKPVVLQKLIQSKRDIISRLELLKEEILKLSIVQGNLNGFREELERRNSEIQALEKEKNKISNHIAIYSKLSTAFGKDGIQAIIMENITEDLRQYANSILRDIYHKPISVDFITQRQTTTGTWKEDFDIVINIENETYDFNDVSGGEQVRISLAIRLALSHLLMRRVGSSVKFLLFDEVDQSLDRHGIEALAETIFELSKDFKILVISHNEYMKEKFEHIITVHMGANGSVLR